MKKLNIHSTSANIYITKKITGNKARGPFCAKCLNKAGDLFRICLNKARGPFSGFVVKQGRGPFPDLLLNKAGDLFRELLKQGRGPFCELLKQGLEDLCEFFGIL
ncbi:Translocon-associated protein subunit gamma [Armadillidium vulgare]|nr:Translocon-associated protein subunit gamma [Armadillidium vulgare]